MIIQYATIGPQEMPPKDIVFSVQTHSSRILEVKTGLEDLSDCDGLWTNDVHFTLGIKTADCAPICFWSDTKIGIVHAGWRGLCNGIVENMIQIFKDEPYSVWVGPLLPRFEIQKDFCYDQIFEKFGDRFFETSHAHIFFDFRSALASILPENARFDTRSTMNTAHLASWRRDKSPDRNITFIRKQML